jgi:serine/threonine protein kinase/TolB-like protein/Tfp pilus assembly protein PilF
MNRGLSANTTLSHYRIISKIGAGGMGEVYLAQDTKLDRKVAIKFLNEEFSHDANKLKRFIQEAKAASALNHPNILTVYEIGQVDGKNYIATELIDGKTLREHLSLKESLSLNTILKIGVQVAEALSAAHHAGIIHRDIKPENIMIRKDGYAKVLDFGLAKLSEPEAFLAGSEDATRAQINTAPGIVMGTVFYMSPEQARGKETDVRTDIWSLGVVLYEMLAGKVPFVGETVNHTVVSILEKEPLVLGNVPDELRRIIRKALTKDVEMRYQSARDLLIDLKNLRRDLDIQGHLERSIVPNLEAATESINENETQAYRSDAVGATRSGPAATMQGVTAPSSSLEYAVTQLKSHKLATAIIGLALLGVISTVAYYFAFVSKGRSQINSIAVMPFINGSNNADIEYLSDGMTETLINSLSQLPELSVKARSSVFRYKGKEVDPQTVGNDLNVQAILNGRVVKRADDLTLYLSLVDTRTGNQLWGEQYNRRQSDLLALQTEIGRDVATKLKTRLSGAEEQKVAKNYTQNAEAYQLYLQGRYFWNKRTPETIQKSIEYFQKAIEKDPRYALGYAGLSDGYALLAYYGGAPAQQVMPKARDAAINAVSLDNNLAESHNALGFVLVLYDYDYAGAEREYQRAIDLNPNYALAHQNLGVMLNRIGRQSEGMAELRRALEIEPLSIVVNRLYGDILVNSRHYDEALTQLKKTVELDPSFPTTHASLASVYQLTGKYAESVESFAKYQELSGRPQTAALARDSFSSGGWQGYLKEMTGTHRPEGVFPYIAATLFVQLGQKDNAFAELDKAFENREWQLLYLKIDPRLDPLRDDPRYQELVRRMRFPG